MMSIAEDLTWHKWVSGGIESGCEQGVLTLQVFRVTGEGSCKSNVHVVVCRT